MQTIEFQIKKTMAELQQSPYHQQFGRKLCAAFVAQQQGIKLDTAMTKVEEPMGDLWLLMAEVIRQQCFEAPGAQTSIVLKPGHQTVQ